MKPALLVIDMQKQFFGESSENAKLMNAAIEDINPVIALFREKNLPVVSVQNMNEYENCVPGEPGYEQADALNLLSSDLHIHKRYRNSFNKTPLEQHLRGWGVDTVIVTGYCAEHCVLTTYRGAEDLDLRPYIVNGSIASGSLENIQFVENMSDMISLSALKEKLEHAA
jgi:nicotinamidase-related amidase